MRQCPAHEPRHGLTLPHARRAADVAMVRPPMTTAHAMLPHLGQGANQAIEDGVALAVFLEGQTSGEIVDALRRYEAFRRERTDVVQSEARKNGLRYDSRYKSLEERDKEIASSAEFRKWLYDYDVEKAAMSYLSKV